MPEQSYAWKSPSAGLTVRLRQSVIFRLGVEAMEARKSIPRRGLEVGGILLGRSEITPGQASIYIDDFVAVPSEHRSGPSYLLSEADLRHFKECVAKTANAIGVYRSQTRLESLSLQIDDVDLFEYCLQDAGKVFLLVSPSMAQGALFLPENGTLALAHSFPFRISELTFEADEPLTIPDAAATLGNGEDSRPSRLRSWRRGYTHKRIGLAVAVCLAALTLALFAVRKEREPAPQPQAIQRQLALDVVTEGPRLLFRWNPQAPAVRDADYAKLHITDGIHNSNIDLAKSDLASGAILYWPESNDVRFRLEVFSPSGASFESIRFMGAKPPDRQSGNTLSLLASMGEPVPSAPKPKVEVKQERAENSGIDVLPNERPRRADASAAFSGVADRVGVQVMVPPQSAQVTSIELPEPLRDRSNPLRIASPVLPPEVKAGTPPVGAAVQTAGVSPQPFISVTAEPVLESGMRRALGRIPLLGRLRKDPQPYEPPQPISQSRPHLSDRDRASLHEATPVDVKVYVTPSGAVEYAEVVSQLPQRDLAAAAVYAARRWTFAPARLGGEQVPSEIILHFVFLPPLEARR